MDVVLSDRPFFFSRTTFFTISNLYINGNKCPTSNMDKDMNWYVHWLHNALPYLNILCISETRLRIWHFQTKKPFLCHSILTLCLFLNQKRIGLNTLNLMSCVMWCFVKYLGSNVPLLLSYLIHFRPRTRYLVLLKLKYPHYIQNIQNAVTATIECTKYAL